jgi:hypothetical protein
VKDIQDVEFEDLKFKKKLDSEKAIEKKLRERVEASKGLAVKLLPFQFAGLPDRMVLLHGGVMFFVEVKSEKKKLRPIQEKVKSMLVALGFKHYTIDTFIQLEILLESYLL